MLNIIIPELKPLSQYEGQYSDTMNSDLGRIMSVQRISEMPYDEDDYGKQTTEFDSFKNRCSFTVTIQLLTRNLQIKNVPYMVSASIGGGSIAMPVRGQIVLVAYFGNSRYPIALGGYNTWKVMRRLIAREIIPELKEGEIFQQAAIRSNPMSLFQEPDSGANLNEIYKGGRIYHDWKGRTIIESRHNRDGGAFVRVMLGNPAVSQADDESNDFNQRDEVSGEYIAAQIAISPTEGYDPVFLLNVDKDGKVSMQFPKAWIGKAAGEGNTPQTTVEIDVVNNRVILDAAEIKSGRDATEKAVLGDTLVDMMGQLIDAIINMRQPVAGAGPTAGPPINIATFMTLKSSLSDMLSNTNKVE